MSLLDYQPEIIAAVQLIQSRLSNISTENPSLYSGLGGSVLFNSYYARYSNNQLTYDRAVSFTEKTLDSLPEVRHKKSFADGFTGIAWLLQHLGREQLIEGVPEGQIAFFDQLINQTLRLFEETGNYDPLYGAVGSGLYFLERSEKCKKQLKSTVDLLYRLSLTDGKFVPWPDYLASPEGVNSPNLGLSHGITGIILFLCKSAEKFSYWNEESDEGSALDYHKKAIHLINHSVEWLLNQENFCGNSMFPNNAGLNEESRLGWSYGDLGIALSIIVSGKFLRKQDWYEKGIEIAAYSLKRDIYMSQLYFDNQDIPDAGFCNGTAGIAVLYQIIYTQTKEQAFKERVVYWMNQTLLSINKAYDQYGTEQVWVKHTHWWNDISLVKGLPGIGLSLLSFIDDQPHAWKRSFLL